MKIRYDIQHVMTSLRRFEKICVRCVSFTLSMTRSQDYILSDKPLKVVLLDRQILPGLMTICANVCLFIYLVLCQFGV